MWAELPGAYLRKLVDPSGQVSPEPTVPTTHVNSKTLSCADDGTVQRTTAATTPKRIAIDFICPSPAHPPTSRGRIPCHGGQTPGVARDLSFTHRRRQWRKPPIAGITENFRENEEKRRLIRPFGSIVAKSYPP